MTSVPKKIGIIGGSGALGAGLAKRWAKSGYQVVVGSRDNAKAQLAAQKLNEEANVNSIVGKENKLAASEADLSFLVAYEKAHCAFRAAAQAKPSKALMPPRADPDASGQGHAS